MSAAGGLRALELYCGIGGFAAAMDGRASLVAAVDVNRVALSVYGHNFPHARVASLIESLTAEKLGRWNADLWWLSPPCQPFTRRGLGRDLDDPRAETFLAALDRIGAVRPRYLGFENVPGFEGSRGHQRLLATLEEAGYGSVRECLLCPTQLGVPNRRRRYYLVAARGRLEPLPEPGGRRRTLTGYLDAGPASELAVEPELVERYRGALHVVDPGDPGAVTHCFTSAYGRSPVRSGSYLGVGDGVRRFSPAEILRLLGFPDAFSLPPELPLENAWRLAGNSLSLDAVRWVLACIPELAQTLTPPPPLPEGEGEPEDFSSWPST